MTPSRTKLMVENLTMLASAKTGGGNSCCVRLGRMSIEQYLPVDPHGLERRVVPGKVLHLLPRFLAHFFAQHGILAQTRQALRDRRNVPCRLDDKSVDAVVD